MSGILGIAVPRHQLPRRADRRGALRARDGHLAARAHGVRRAAGSLYLAAIGATTLILVMAANTAYADFPRLAALQAADGFLPRQLTYRGSRLVYSRGIVVLALVASLLIVVFDASVTGLIPLYAIGVFLSFTLSQAGMARRWWKIGPARARAGAAGARLGAAARPALAPEDGRERRRRRDHGRRDGHLRGHEVHDGAWVVLIVIPLLVARLLRDPPPLPDARAGSSRSSTSARRRASTATA